MQLIQAIQVDPEKHVAEGHERKVRPPDHCPHCRGFNTLWAWGLLYPKPKLHYLVVEEKLLKSHEIFTGWGLLVRTPTGLELVEKPIWQDINVEHQVVFLRRIAAKKVPAL